MRSCEVLTMKSIFVPVIIFALGVEMFTCQGATTKQPTTIHPYAHLEPYLFEYPAFEDPACHIAHKKCLNKLKESKPLCAVEKYFGLMNYKNICEIHLHNCLSPPAGTTHIYGVVNKNDKIFYNGKEHNCLYYYQKAKNPVDAIKLYYKTAQVNEEVSNDLN